MREQANLKELALLTRALQLKSECEAATMYKLRRDAQLVDQSC